MLEIINLIAGAGASLGGVSFLTFLITRTHLRRESKAKALSAEADAVERIDKIWRDRVEELSSRIGQLERMVAEQTEIILTLRRQLAGIEAG